MHGRMSRKTFQTLAHVNQFSYLFIRIVQLFQLRIHRKRPVQRHIQLGWNHLGNAVHKGVRKIHDTSHIPDDSPRRQGTEGNNLHHPVCSVFSRYIIDDLLPSLEAEVHVDIRHGDTLRIQEPLKEQVIPDRINVGNSKTVGHDTSRRGTSSRSHHNVMIPCILDEIPHDQEVVHIPHRANRIQLIIQPLHQFLGASRIPVLQPVKTKLLQIFP